MKKILLGTTALVGAATLATAALAGPSVSVGGFADFQVGLVDQDFDTGAGANSRDAKFQNDTEIHVSVSGSSDSGLKYGAVVELNADVTGDGDADGGNADKAYLWLESSAGRLELGANAGAQNTMGISAGTIARATGGIDGDWYDFVDTATNGPFIIRPDLPSAAAGVGGGREDATKITYYTPRMSGLQLGVSFTPDEGDRGTALFATGEIGTDQESVLGLGLSYVGNYDSVGVQASITGEFGESEAAGTDDTAAWSLGLALDWGNFSLAGSWMDWSDSGLATGVVNDDQDAWTLGGAYVDGPWGLSITYLNSDAQGDDLTNLSIGADYQLAPGLVPYVEVSFFDLDDAAAGAVDNDGSVVLIGAQLSF